MTYEVRQLGLGGILDQAVVLLKNHFGVLFGVLAVLFIPYLVVVGLINAELIPAIGIGSTPEEMAEAQRAQARYLPLIIVMSVVQMLFILPLTNAAMIRAVADLYLTETTSIGRAYGTAFRRLIPLLLTAILYYLAVGVGFLLLIIPGIIFAFWFLLYTHVVVLEEVSGTTALGRSRELMKGNIGTAFVLGLLIGIINIAVTIGAGFIQQPHVSAVVLAVIQGLLTAFAATAFVVFYFSCRCQHEAFDLEHLAQSLGTTPAAAPDRNNPYSYEDDERG